MKTKYIQLDELCKADLGIYYNRSVKAGDFIGSFKTFRELVYHRRLETEQQRQGVNE